MLHGVESALLGRFRRSSTGKVQTQILMTLIHIICVRVLQVLHTTAPLQNYEQPG